MISNYVVQLQFWASVIYVTPLNGLLAVWGAICALSGISPFVGAMMGVIGYCIVSDIGMITFFGERDFLMMGSYALGAILVNMIFFDLFF